MKITKILVGSFLTLGLVFASCEKEENLAGNNADSSIETTTVNESNDLRAGKLTIGYYHNEILEEMILTHRVMTRENEEEVYRDIKALAESYMGGEAFDYAAYLSYEGHYIPNSDLSMDEAITTIEGTLITDMAESLSAGDYITDAELAYYSDFNDEFYATTNYEDASAIIASYITTIAGDRALSTTEKDRLAYSFDIGKHSLDYWEAEAADGVESNWDVIVTASTERRPKWITVLLKVGADLCGGAVGGGIGFAIGGPIGAGVGGAAGGAAASAFMFN